MASINDVGVAGQPLGTPPLTPWQKAVRDALNGSDLTVDARIAKGAPWAQWTPTTGGAVYSAVNAWWTKADVVKVVVKATVTSVSGDLSFTLPAQAHPDVVGSAIGTARLISNGAAYFAFVYLAGTTTANVRLHGTNGVLTTISPTIPNTWKVGDLVMFTAWYPTP